jgi:protein-S-isoprenylcysteine O-methyltransferase Ste14
MGDREQPTALPLENGMKASAIEFRLRMWIQVVIIVLGFWAPWIGTLDLSRRISTLAWLALGISRSGLVGFSVATPIVIVCGALAALTGAVLRVWGVAYLGYGVVHHGDMQGCGVMAAGPYRYVRNPLYLGGWFMLLAMCLLMAPSGALFTLVLVTIHFLRLILGEEAFLTAKLGEPYREYLRAVPRLVPRFRSSLPAAAAHPHWLIALGTELNPIGIFVTMAVLSWTYDNLLMIKTIVIVFGVSLIVKALMLRSEAKAETA